MLLEVDETRRVALRYSSLEIGDYAGDVYKRGKKTKMKQPRYLHLSYHHLQVMKRKVSGLCRPPSAMQGACGGRTFFFFFLFSSGLTAGAGKGGAVVHPYQPAHATARRARCPVSAFVSF